MASASLLKLHISSTALTIPFLLSILGALLLVLSLSGAFFCFNLFIIYVLRACYSKSSFLYGFLFSGTLLPCSLQRSLLFLPECRQFPFLHGFAERAVSPFLEVFGGFIIPVEPDQGSPIPVCILL